MKEQYYTLCLKLSALMRHPQYFELDMQEAQEIFQKDLSRILGELFSLHVDRERLQELEDRGIEDFSLSDDSLALFVATIESDECYEVINQYLTKFIEALCLYSRIECRNEIEEMLYSFHENTFSIK